MLPSVTGGANLSANTDRNQAVLTCPVPGSASQYYIFTNSDTAINFSIVDASLAGNSVIAKFPLGEMSGAINRSMGLPNASEGMILIESGNGQTYWLISQDRTSFDFHITNITSTGFTTKDTTLFTGALPGFEVNQFAFNADSLQLALAPKTANRNLLILDFDPTNGRLSFNKSVRNTGVSDEIYDVEWSSDGSKIYYSVMGNSSNTGGLFQIDFADTVNNNPFIINPLLNYSFNKSYGLQRGIDERIYHLYQLNAGDPFILGRLENIDSTFDLVTYDSLVFDENFNATQFPFCAPPQLADFISVSFEYLDSCQGQTTQFFPLVIPEPNNYFWNFGDGTGSNAAAPLKTYDTPGSYNVQLVAELNGRFKSFAQMINIIAADSADLGNDTTICPGEKLILDPKVTGAIGYIWSTGDTTPTIEVDTANTFWVNVLLPGGCTVYDEIVITLYGVTETISNQWYFGNGAAVDFTTGAPVSIDGEDNLMDSPEGCATISDVNGELLFYTNGQTVWNKEHKIMVNGTLLGGDSIAAQSAMIMPFSDDATMFYIFTTEEVYGDDTHQLKYSIVDMKGDTARGEVVKKGIVLVDKSTERITTTGFTGNDFILAHEFGNNNFRLYNLSGNGISGAIHSSIGERHTKEDPLNSRGYMKFSPLNTGLALLIPGTPNRVEIFDLNQQSGAISLPKIINLQESAPLEAYGLEYSPNGERLYVSFVGAGSKIIQLNLGPSNNPNDAATIEASKTTIATPGEQFGALQIGPDGVMYVARDGTSDLGQINSADTDLAVFAASSLALDGDGVGNSRLGLPNFRQQISNGQTPSMDIAIACVGQETGFSATGRDNSIETYKWDFGDGNVTGFLTSPDTTHIYTAEGTFSVVLTLRNHCDIDSMFTQDIDVFGIPEAPMVPSDTALCGGTITLAAWNVDRPDFLYEWSTGQTTREVTFTSPQFVTVTIYNTDSCSSGTAEVFIGDGGTSIDIGPDLILCQNDVGPTLDANNIGPQFVWTSNGIMIGDERLQTVNTTRTGTFIYRVAVTNTFTGCTSQDSIQVQIIGEPTVRQVNTKKPTCNASNGSFELNFTSAGSFSYSISGIVNAGPFSFDGPGTTFPIDNIPSGNYTVTTTNVISGCQNVEVFQLEDDALYEMEAISQNGCFKTGDIKVILRNFTGSRVDVNVLDKDGNVVYDEKNRSAANIRIDNLDTGTYFVSTRQVIAPNCTQIDTVVLKTGVECFRTIVAPNAFSPGNQNGLNDEYFVFPNQYIDKFEVLIYNRWGQLVYHSKDKNFRWDGTYNNHPSAPGTYAMKMVFTSSLEPNLGDIVQYGSITLIR
jgi:gliding motility-associated-like protein